MRLSNDELEILEVLKAGGRPISAWDLLQETKIRGLHWNLSELGFVLQSLKAGRLITCDESGIVTLAP